MVRSKIIYYCTNCGAESPKWIGKCPSCGEWNTYREEEVAVKSGIRSQQSSIEEEPTSLSNIPATAYTRLDTHDAELNRVLGGGIVPGSLILIGGEPGIGKSTLLLQVVLQHPQTTLYISGEESLQQIKLRATRTATQTDSALFMAETHLEKVIKQAKRLDPDLLVIDSIQTIQLESLDAAPGSVTQIRECTAALMQFAKQSQIPVVIIGHITKEGSIAGPKLLEHMVDVVLQFEGDRHHTYRMVRTLKNRFGSADELGIYEMTAAGLRIVTNPSELLLSQSEEQMSGAAIGATMEGMRPLLIESQALVSTAVYGTPQRSTTGFDLRRLSMILAVLEKRCGFNFGQQDVFLNIAGGLKVMDPAMDLAVAAALISSLEEIAIPSNWCFAAEVGLTGEVRAVNRIEQRIQEAQRLGMDTFVLSGYNIKGIKVPSGTRLLTISRIQELYDLIRQANIEP
ncbi:MAG: DNA repair protein RadA [Lewinellaceae bacterium]|nr:DNA repair protein RadA [Lewinellaceae bacterium]HPQ98310.1 DNA repair protein RadA [Saprospiraceae bacterium]